MMVKVHNVSVTERLVQLDFSVNLTQSIKVTINQTGPLHVDVEVQSCSTTGAYLLPLVRFGNARVWDDFSCVNFAGGQVCHLIAFGKSSLKRLKVLLTFCTFGSTSENCARNKCRYLSQNFPTAVALSRGGIDPNVTVIYESCLKKSRWM